MLARTLAYCFVLELEQHLEAPRQSEQHYGMNIHIGFHSSQLSIHFKAR